MKKYKVIVNGVEYEVEIELVADDGKAASPSPAPAQAAPAPAAAPSGGDTVKAPLAGTVTTVNVKAGDAVKKGQILMILESMKMENEIICPHDGTVSSVPVNAGASVEAGDALCAIGR
ncbi:MAG: biotin/lipoyl-binding protein [Clostridia bacterium]|nr:biotin/lipoyl-binding protein [Clostridia bacterium]